MNLELLGIILNTCLTALIIFFIICDHIKDDRLLTKQVQEFYWNIEGLIYTYYYYNLYKALFNILRSFNVKQFEDYKAINYGEIDRQFKNKLFYLREKVRLGIKDYGKYIGIIEDQREETKSINPMREKKLDINYFSDTDMILSYYGELLDLTSNPIVKDFTKISQAKEGWDIYYFLRSLRFYWKSKYKKALLRKELKIKKKHIFLI